MLRARGHAETYRRLFGSPPTPAEIELIEGGFRSRGEWTDDLDHLLEAPRARALQWIEEKARNADGLRPACALLAPSLLEVSILQVKGSLGPLPIRRSRKSWDGWPLMLFGLQNTTAGLSLTALAARHGVSVSTAGRYVRLHSELVTGHAAYAEACRLAMADALEKTYARSRIS